MGRVLARQRRARGILAALGRRYPQQQADCDRQWSRIHEHISAYSYPRNPATLESDDEPEARLSSDAIGFLRPATSGSDGVVGRCLWLVLGFAPSGGCRAELRALWLSVLDNGRRRLLAAPRQSCGRSEISGTLRAVV